MSNYKIREGYEFFQEAVMLPENSEIVYKGVTYLIVKMLMRDYRSLEAREWNGELPLAKAERLPASTTELTPEGAVVPVSTGVTLIRPEPRAFNFAKTREGRFLKKGSQQLIEKLSFIKKYAFFGAFARKEAMSILSVLELLKEYYGDVNGD